MKITRFEDLKCWQEARFFTRSVYGYVNRSNFSKDHRLSGQITGATISIMNNICEGFAAHSNKEFIRFLRYSRRSCSEAQNCLYIALDQSYIRKVEFKTAYQHCSLIRKMIDGLVRYLKEHRSPPVQKLDKPTQLTQPT
jgi:four helix bundle protein